MDALVQLYGPFDINSDSLPHFDKSGKPSDKDSDTKLSSRLQIASSEGCCKRLGSGIGSHVTPGRYVLIIFHCSIGPNEGRSYKVTYTLDTSEKPIPNELYLGSMSCVVPSSHSRSVNQLFRVMDPHTKGSLVTKFGEIFKVSVRTDDSATQGQVRVAVFQYSSEKLSGNGNALAPSKENHISYTFAHWGDSVVTFQPEENQVLDDLLYCSQWTVTDDKHCQVLFVRVSILNGHSLTNIKTIILRENA